MRFEVVASITRLAGGIMARRQKLLVLLTFFVGACAGLFIGKPIQNEIGRVLFPVHWREVVRATSPDGITDAILANANCGAPCPSEYSLSLVARGAQFSSDPSHRIFMAEAVISPQIRWMNANVLEISYAQASIDEFRNLAYPLVRRGDEQSWNHRVEVRLMAESHALPPSRGTQILSPPTTH